MTAITDIVYISYLPFDIAMRCSHYHTVPDSNRCIMKRGVLLAHLMFVTAFVLDGYSQGNEADAVVGTSSSRKVKPSSLLNYERNARFCTL
jgi:hypothetical protein